MSISVDGIGCISPQQTWNDESTLLQAFDYRGNHVYAVEPDYHRWMSGHFVETNPRLIKMAVAAASIAMHDAGVKIPDALILGTGFGLLNESQTLVRASFMDADSTASSRSQVEDLAHTLAYHLRCNGQSSTFMQDGLSFESALLNTIIIMREKPDLKILIGGLDEYAESTNVVLTRMGRLRKKIASTLHLFKPLKPGTVQGEGAAFFLLSSEVHDKSQAEIVNMAMIENPSPQKLQDFIEVFIRDNGLTPGEIDFVLSGRNGDKSGDQTFDETVRRIMRSTPSGVYKHLCGEFPTASAFGLWLAVRILKGRHVPGVVTQNHITRPIKTLLIINTYFHGSYSVMLLKSCQRAL